MQSSVDAPARDQSTRARPRDTAPATGPNAQAMSPAPAARSALLDPRDSASELRRPDRGQSASLSRDGPDAWSSSEAVARPRAWRLCYRAQCRTEGGRRSSFQRRPPAGTSGGRRRPLPARRMMERPHVSPALSKNPCGRAVGHRGVAMRLLCEPVATMSCWRRCVGFGRRCCGVGRGAPDRL